MKLSLEKSTLQFILLLIIIVGFCFLEATHRLDIQQIRTWLAQYPLWLSGFFYILIYVGVTTILWFGTIDFFRITGALLFGPYWSTLFVYLAEIGNASILFLISRRLGREFIEKKFHFKDKDRKYSPETAGLWTALALRINPLVPFRFMDVGFGLTKLSFQKYFWAVVIGSPLRIFWVQFIITGVGEAILKNPRAMMEYLQTNRFAFWLSVFYLAGVLVITIAAVVRSRSFSSP